MNSSYSLEKLAWARQEDLRRAAGSIELMPLRPNSAQVKGNSTRLHRFVAVACGAALAALLIAQLIASAHV